MKTPAKVSIILFALIAATVFFQTGRIHMYGQLLASAVNEPRLDLNTLMGIEIAHQEDGGLAQLLSEYGSLTDIPSVVDNRQQALIIGQSGDNDTANFERVLSNMNIMVTVCSWQPGSITWRSNITDSGQVDGEDDYLSKYDLVILLPSALRAADDLSRQIHDDVYDDFYDYIYEDVYDDVYAEFYDYVTSGGNLLLVSNEPAASGLRSALYELAGVSDSYDVCRTAEIKFHTELISGIRGDISLTGETLSPHEYFQYCEYILDNDCLIHLESADGDPLIWQRQVLNGQIMMINTGSADSRYFTGLLNGTVSVLCGFAVWPVPAACVVFVDDFLAEYASDPEWLRQKYGRDYERFEEEIFWPELNNLADKFNLRLSASCLISPGTADSSSRRYLLSEIVSIGGEVCLHGSVHQPLSLDRTALAEFGYEAWPDEVSAIASLEPAKSTIEQLLPLYDVQVYVPPSDLMDEALIPSLTEYWPRLAVISGLYYEPAGREGRIDEFLIQDVAIEANRINLPRISAGALLTDESFFLLASALTAEGLVSHTISVNEVADRQNNGGLACAEIMETYSDSWNQILSTYSWLSPMTASQAALAVFNSERSEISWRRESDNLLKLSCIRFTPGLTLMMVSNEPVEAVSGCTAVPIDSLRWLIKLEQPQAILRFEVGDNENMSDS